MKSRWDENDAGLFDTPLGLRAYSSRLIGSDEDLVLHGGGNTSLKSVFTDLFGVEHETLYVKGSGWDLASIEPAGFAPVKLSPLKRLAELDELSDGEMVRQQRLAMLDPGAPNPSVEAILHAIIPFRYVDHTHADAVVTLTNTPDGERAIREVYGDRVLIVPYVMPGFVLARRIADLTRDVDWSALEGMVLMHHGVFSFADEARESYEAMVHLVDEAERYMDNRGALTVATNPKPRKVNAERLSRLRQAVSMAADKPMVVRIEDDAEAAGFSELDNARSLVSRGPLTPDHVIRTKRVPMFIDGDVDEAVAEFIDGYKRYFLDNTDGAVSPLDPAPRWGVWPGHGTLSFGKSAKEAGVVSDIVRHTVRAIQWAEALGGWQALSEADIFNVEYWELEQAKLRQPGHEPPFAGKVAVVTGAGSGIGRACAARLLDQGAAVVALDIQPPTGPQFEVPALKAITCDMTDSGAVSQAVEDGVKAFGGVDIVISNAGEFPRSRAIADMDEFTWGRSLEINLSSHQRLLRYAAPYLKNGIDPAVIVVGSKNVPAPGREASAYSAAKAGLTQLARIAALELGEHGIRVNTVHPNAVFDTGMWSESVLQRRARSYNMTVDEYKTSNVLKTAVTAADVARMVCAMAGTEFAKTTGAQVPVDGGNERVI